MSRLRRRVPLYMSQDQIDRLALLLYRHQVVANTLSTHRDSVSEEAGCFLTELRKQCCVRSGAADPFEDMPMSPQFGKEA